jgi:hypothetical protein
LRADLSAVFHGVERKVYLGHRFFPASALSMAPSMLGYFVRFTRNGR